MCPFALLGYPVQCEHLECASCLCFAGLCCAQLQPHHSVKVVLQVLPSCTLCSNTAVLRSAVHACTSNIDWPLQVPHLAHSLQQPQAAPPLASPPPMQLPLQKPALQLLPLKRNTKTQIRLSSKKLTQQLLAPARQLALQL